MIFICMSMTLILMTLLMTTILLTTLFNKSIIMSMKLISMNTMELNFTIILDKMSSMFSITVMFISTIMTFYSYFYMGNNKELKWYYTMMFSFIISMLMIIISPSIFSVIIGWDLLGLTSYFLVIFYNDLNSMISGYMTFLNNRISDLLILSSLYFFLNEFSMEFFFLKKIKLKIFILISISIMIKSAQYPFISWLPMAMAAPTPISALVHSSTLVTSGIYLMIRFNYFLINTNIFNLIYYLSLFSLTMGSLMACYENDFKKMIAYSTLSQMSLLMMMISMKEESICFFYLIVHALSKSMLFMIFGFLMNSNMNNQDNRILSFSFKINMLFTFSSMISISSMLGLPFMSGFFIKDIFLEKLFSFNFKIMETMMFILSINLTLIYTMRFMKMMTSFQMKKMIIFSQLNNKKYMSLFTIMSILSILSGTYLFMIENIENFNIMFFSDKMICLSLLILFMNLTKKMKSTKMKNSKMMFLTKNIILMMWSKMNKPMKFLSLKSLDLGILTFLKLFFLNIPKNKMMKINLKLMNPMELSILMFIFLMINLI